MIAKTNCETDGSSAALSKIHGSITIPSAGLNNPDITGWTFWSGKCHPKIKNWEIKMTGAQFTNDGAVAVKPVMVEGAISGVYPCP